MPFPGAWAARCLPITSRLLDATSNPNIYPLGLFQTVFETLLTISYRAHTGCTYWYVFFPLLDCSDPVSEIRVLTCP